MPLTDIYKKAAVALTISNVGIEYLINLLQDKITADILESKYELNIKKFYELTFMGPIAFILDFFIIGGLAKKIAFGIVDMRRDNPFHLVLAISAVSVAFMCPCMSFAATVLIKHAPASQIIPTWLQTTAMNFPMAFFWQIFYAGPFVRFIFGKLFPEKEKAAASAE